MWAGVCKELETGSWSPVSGLPLDMIWKGFEAAGML